MLRPLLLVILLEAIASSPLYRKEHKEPELSEDLGPMPEEPRLPLPPTAVPLATVTQIVPAEEIKQVVSAMVLEPNFDLEITETKGDEEQPRVQAGAPHKSVSGEMDVIRKPAPIIDLTVVETLKVKSTEPITTTKKTPSLVESPIDVLPDEKDNEGEPFGVPLDEKSQGVKEFDYEFKEDLTEVSDLSLAIKEEKAPKPTEKPCDVALETDFLHLAKPGVPGTPGETELTFDEESIVRIIVYVLSILTEPEMGQPTTWQKIIAGIQCVLRDCREALSLRPTMKLPLNDDAFVIRRARDSMCDCNIDL